MTPEYRTIQRNTLDINNAIANQSDASLFADKLVDNDFITKQAANNIVQVPAANYHKVSQLMQAVDAQIRTASNPTTAFETFIRILRELSLDQLAGKLVESYRQLKPDHREPLSSQGSGPAPSSTSLQLELTIDDLLEVTYYLLDLGQIDIHSLGLTLGLSYHHLRNMSNSDTFRDDMIAAWLQKEDQVLKRGVPTWETLAKALRHPIVNQTGVADRIEIDKLIVSQELTGQLKPDRRGPFSSQGSETAPSSTSLQQELTIGDLVEVTDCLLDFGQADIYYLGLILGLSYHHLKSMSNPHTFRDDMIAAWLQKEDQVLKRGVPTWNTLVKALRHPRVNQTGVAEKIETEKLDELIGLKLNDRSILNVLHEAEFADAHWELLGEQLIKHFAVLNIRANRYGDPSLCMIDTISQWLRTDLEASWEKLAGAVANVEQYGEATANRVREKAGIAHGPQRRMATDSGPDSELQEKPLFDNEYGEEILSKHRPVQCTNSDEFQTIEEFAQKVEIVIQSCNRNEYCASLELMEAPQIPKPDGQSQLFEKAVQFPNKIAMKIALGVFAGHKAAIAWTEQGASCENDIRKVLDWFPNTKALLGVGMAYGMKRDMVKFCDVLVASQIADFGSQPRGQDGGFYARGEFVKTKTTLKNIFCKDDAWWKFPCTAEKRPAKVVVGQLVSGPFLLDDPKLKQSIQEQCKFAKGGEMEGWVLYNHILKDHPNLEAIIIKGVADYADGEKDKRWQLTAAMAAASYTHFQLKHSTAFHVLENQSHFEAYQQALKKGVGIPLKYLKVLFFGPPRTGKTSMRRRLVGEIQNLKGESIQNSTGVADVHEVIAEPADDKTTTSEVHEAILKPADDKTITSVAFMMRSTENAKSTKTSTVCKWSSVKSLRGKGNSNHGTDLDGPLQKLYQYLYKKVPSKKGRSPVSNEEGRQDHAIKRQSQAKVEEKGPTQDLPQETDLTSKTDNQVASDSEKVSSGGQQGDGLHKKEIEEIEEVLQAFNKILVEPGGKEELEDLLEDWVDKTILMSMVDTGGQPAFLDMLPALTIGPALYLIFFRLDQELQQCYKLKYGRKGENIELEDIYTNEQVIFQALSSIACFSCTTPIKEGMPNPYHAAVLIGTYKDKLEGDPETVKTEIKKKDEQLRETLAEILECDLRSGEEPVKWYSKEQLMFAVDNMNGDNNELAEVHQQLEQAIKQMYTCDKKPGSKWEIPGSWLMFSIVIRRMRKHTLSLSQCHEIGRKLNLTDRDTNAALWFLHHYVGILMHFSDVPEIEDIVICDPQVVFDSVTFLIHDSFTFDNVGKRVTKFQNTGQFSYRDLILKISVDPEKEILRPEQLVSLLVYLNIIAPLSCLPQLNELTPPPSDAVYFMPAVLKHATEEELSMKQIGKNPVPLMIRFKCGFVPVGVFCAMIASLVAGGKKWKLLEPRDDHKNKSDRILRKNKVTFRMYSTYDITLISRPKRYEIHVDHIATLKSTSFGQDSQELLKTVCDTLDGVLSKYKHLCSSYPDERLYELGFKCSQHQEDDDYDDHLVVNRPNSEGKQSPLSFWFNYYKNESIMVCTDEEVAINIPDSAPYRDWFGTASAVPRSSTLAKPKFLDNEQADLMKRINPVPFQQTDEKALKLFADQVVLILQTCNQREYLAALERLELPTKEDHSKIGDRLSKYPAVGSVIGWFAGYRTAVVRTKQGNKCRGDLREALNTSFPKARVIIGAGIAYANDRKRKFADVLISDQVENIVQHKKEGDEITNQGSRQEIEPDVQRVFEMSASDWSEIGSFTCADDDRTSVVHIGCIVSAPTLVRDEKLRGQLMKHTPYAIGGEMEGWVLLELKKELKREHNRDIDIIVIKGVADYGDLSKADEWQWTAAKAAMDCIHYCLSQTGGREFGATEIAKKEDPPSVLPEQTTAENHSKPKFLGSERTDLLKQINPVPFQQTDEKALQLFADQVVLILHTCNANEYWAALERLELPTKEDGSQIGDCLINYPQVGSVIGWFAGYRAAVVRTGQGNECRYDLTTGLTKSFQKGRVIIGAGIAYANNRERKFADVLVSKQIENFVQYKIVNGDVTNRGPREEIALNVQRVFENSARNWTDMEYFQCADDGRTSAAHIGCIVSAPTLIRDEVLRDQLMKHTPNAIGGEMEGWVLLELKKTLKGQHNKDIEIIVIKGVADYGDLSKGDEWQWTAAKAAIDCIHYCLNQTGGREFGGVSNVQHEIGQNKGKRTATGIEMANEDEGVPVTKKTKLEEGVSNVQHEISQSKGKRTATGIEMANEDEGVPVTKKTKLEEEEKPLYDNDEHSTAIFKKCDPLLCTKTEEHKAVDQFAKQVVIVIQSCNENEYYALLELMKAPEIPKSDGQSQLFERAVRFPNTIAMKIVLGMYAGHKAAIAWTEQGASCERDIRKVLGWFPNTKAILGVGVAFGMKRDAVKFCDVLVAEQIADFGDRPRAEKGGIDARDDVVRTKTALKNMFCKNTIGWEFLCTNTNRLAKVVPGLLVSGPLLLDDATIKQRMLEQFKDAKGGEMEGWILYTHIVNDRDILKDHPNLEAIIIKGVADYADGEKDKRWQLTAAMAAASYTHFQLKRSTAFRGVQPQTCPPQPSFQQAYQQTGSSTHAAGMQQQPGTQYPPHHPSTGPLAQGASYQATVLNPDDMGELEVCLRSIAADWDKLARQLRMGQDVPNIRKTPGLIDNQGYLGELLDRWLNGDQPTLQILYQALDNLREITTQKAAVNKAITKLEEFQRNRAGRGD